MIASISLLLHEKESNLSHDTQYFHVCYLVVYPKWIYEILNCVMISDLRLFSQQQTRQTPQRPLNDTHKNLVSFT